MGFDNQIIEKIKDKLLLSTLISRKVNLRKRSGKLIGLCPFHNEKTPSFSVNDVKGVYHCFGCQASGDIFTFLMETERINFQEAIIEAASIAGISLPKIAEFTPENNNLYALLLDATKWFQSQLLISSGYRALQYLQNRNLHKEVVNHFMIGYAPEQKDALYKFLISKNYTNEQIKEAGLVIEKSSELVDKFRNRIIFPIFNHKNQVIAFGGRALGDSIPKYLNSPETVLFKKSEILFAENFARSSALKSGRVVVVEGYMDAIALHKNDICETVATLGTAITNQHLERLWKLASEPIICLDGDVAGMKSMQRAAELAFSMLSEGKSLNFVILPNGKDPDDFIAEYGKSCFLEKLNNAIPLSEIIFESEKNKMHSKTPEQISSLEKKLSDLVDKITSARLRKNYHEYFKNKIWQLTKGKKTKKATIPENISHIYKNKLIDQLDIITRYEYILVAEIINQPELLAIDKIYNQFVELEFKESFLSQVRSVILEHHPLTKLAIEEILVKNQLEREFLLLCGSDSTFVDHISKGDINQRASKWELLFKKYLLSIMEKEYFNNILKINNEQAILGLKDEMETIRDSIKLQEQLIDS